MKNKAGLSDEKLSLLADDFKQLNEVGPHLDEMALRYAVDGEGDEILSILSNTAGCGKAIKLNCCTYMYGEKSRDKFFNGFNVSGPSLYLRIAKIYEACAKQDNPRISWNDIPWLEILIREIAGGYYNYKDKIRAFNLKIAEEMLKLEGLSEDTLIRKVFLVDMKDWQARNMVNYITVLKDFSEAAMRHSSVVIEALSQKDSQSVVYTLDVLKNHKIPTEPFMEKILEHSISPLKKVRDASQVFLPSKAEESLIFLKKKAREGNGEERLNSVKLILKLGGDNEKAFLSEILKEEKSKKIKDILSEMLEYKEMEEQESNFILNPLPDISSEAPLGPEVFDAFSNFVEEYVQLAIICYEESKKRYPHYAAVKPEPFTKIRLEEAFKNLQYYKRGDKINIFIDCYLFNKEFIEIINKFFTIPSLKLIHAVRFLILMGQIHINANLRLGYKADELLRYYKKTHKVDFGLRELAQIYKVIGLNDKTIGWERVIGYGCFRWDPELVWPYFWENIDILEDIFEVKKPYNVLYCKNQHRKNGYEVLFMMPHVPPSLIGKLMEIALGSPKSERPMAQKCLEKLPDIKEKVINYIKSPKEEVRAIAAEWLGRMGAKEGIKAIEEGLKKEKGDMAKASFITALETLGQPVEKYLNRDRLLEDARKLLKGDVPKELFWFPFDKLPSVCWADSGKEADRDIIKYFIIKSFKLKSPEPDALLRRYCSYFKSLEREDLGKFILSSWISQDTIPAHTYEEASVLADKDAKITLQWYKESTYEELYKKSLNHHLSVCKGSAIKEKGILALAGACCGRDAVPLMGRYIKEWYGQRLHQCKALIQVLAWIDHPSAIQLLLSIAKRFRTKGIQEEADKYVNLLAERKGWTVDELADRTIPTAGFDEKGELELDYGSRIFTAKIDKNFNITLTDTDGKVIKSLPAPRKDDDDEKVKEAKKLFSGGKKEVSAILKLQKERLYEAMCVQRSWRFEDWDTYLNKHPFISRYCERLVWALFEEDKLVKTFRPLSDGTFTDYEDEEVEINSEGIIKLAHSCNVSEEVSKAWIDHLSDYEVTPLFFQFGQFYKLPEDKKDATEISDYEGYLLEAFSLRGFASKFGYVRGQTEDAGWFYDYKKTFPTLGLEVYLEFTGNYLPEENRTVALRSLYFTRIAEDKNNYYRDRLPLCDISPVLLSEAWNEMKTIASSGSGFAIDWEKKTEY